MPVIRERDIAAVAVRRRLPLINRRAVIRAAGLSHSCGSMPTVLTSALIEHEAGIDEDHQVCGATVHHHDGAGRLQ
jgi:hypothetical protein